MKKMLCAGLLTLAALSVGTLSAGEVDNLYQAEVAADASTAQWQQDAFAQVLARVSGQQQLASQPVFAEELRRASGYIKQFEAVRSADGNRMKVLVDAVKINQLLQQHNVAVWGALRPDILIWLVEQQGAQRQFVRRPEHPITKALRKAFSQSALPLLLPLYDMDDILILNETDVWAGFWQPINQASARYNADVIVAATIEQMTLDNNPQFRISWQHDDNGKVVRDELVAANEDELMQAFAWKLAQQLAATYASVMAEQPQQFILQVNGLPDLASIVRVQQLLQQVVGVSAVTISQYQQGAVRYLLQSAVAAPVLLNALQFNPRLRLVVLPDNDMQLDTTVAPVLATLEYIKF